MSTSDGSSSGSENKAMQHRTTLLQPGEVVATHFEIVRVLGRGGMGVVYEVKSLLTGDRLAMKTILPVHLSNERAVQRFLEEIRTMRRLSHPNIAAVFDVGEDINGSGTALFFTMEFLEGVSLRDIMKKRGPMKLEQVVRVLDHLCEALEFAHKYMVHRDLSPENVMILKDGTIKMLDFGLARMADRKTMTAANTALGKAHYMSPE